MTQRRHITLVAAGATILAALPLATIFEHWTWLIQVLLVVGAMTGAAVGLRSLRSPGWLPTLGMAAAYVVSLTWLFSDKAFLGLIPLVSSFREFNDHLVEAGISIQENAVPIGDDKGLLFLASLGIGAVALSVDLAAVVARRPAIAGLPMVAIYLVAVGTNGGSVSFLSFVATASAFLWLLATDNVDRVRRFGRRFTGDGRDVDVWEPSPLAAAGRRLAVVGVTVAVLLPIAVPGMTTGLLDRFGTGVGSGGSGGSGKGAGRGGNVTMFGLLRGQLVRDRTYPMVKVTTNDPNPFYLRFGVAEDVRADGFINRNWGPGSALNNLPQPATSGPGVTARNYRADVEIINFSEQVLPIFEQPTKFSRLDKDWFWDKRASVLYSQKQSARAKKYGFDYVHLDYTPDALRNAPNLGENHPMRQQFTQVPDVSAVQKKADELTKGKTRQYDKVRAIYDFFTSPASGFVYDVNTRSGNSGSIMVDFLTNKRGYCEQYAAAMGWLVRAAGIPARVAFGFTRGTNDRNSGEYLLSNHNLHAWTEVYFEGFGWLPFDATPASSISGAAPTAWAPDPSRPSSGPNSESPDDIPIGEASGGPGAEESTVGDPNAIGGGSPGGSGNSLPLWPFYLVAAIVVALLLVLLPAVRRSNLRRRRRPGAPDASPVVVAGTFVDEGGVDLGDIRNPAEPRLRQARRDAHAAWAELVDTMTDFNIAVDPAETPRATVERVVRERHLAGPADSGAALLGQAEERARYARTPMLDADLAPAIGAVRTAIRERVSLRTRVLATLFPRSVLMRWRIASMNWSSQAMATAAARRDAVSRAVSPRRLLMNRR